MNFLIVIVLLIAAVTGFFGLARFLGWEAVEGWRDRLLGEISSRFQMAGIVATFIGSLPIPPETMLWLWNSLPVHVGRQVPQGIMITVGIVLFVLSWLSKYVQQPKLRAKIEAKKK